VANGQDHAGERRAREMLDRTHRLIKDTPLATPAAKVANWVRAVIAPTPEPDPIAAPMWVPPGHFFSPVPSAGDVEASRARIERAPPASIPGIDLRLDDQLALLERFRGFYDDQPFPAERADTTRYWFENPSFGYADALVLYSMLRYLEPNHVIEVGAGWSSCVILDTRERFLDWQTQHTLIEPYPQHLLTLFRDGDLDRIRLIAEKVQDVPVAQFQELGANDILFIDSTHVSKLNSDVNYEFFEILPVLQSGVYVHLHDIFYPFEYPLGWAEEGRGWNEAYLLRAFLTRNDEFEIVLFNNLLWQRFEDVLLRDFPLWLRNPGGSIWLRKR
jgi:hypothetical protein